MVLGPEEARASSEQLLEAVSGLKRYQLYLDSKRQVSASIRKEYCRLVSLRKARQPLAYLRGTAFFWNEELSVDQRCLIPRCDTEVMIETFIEKSGISKEDAFSFADLGTGSGAIAIAILRHFKHAQGTLIDISAEALEVAKKNLTKYKLLDRVRCVHSNLFNNVSEDRAPRWDVIFSNPPYFNYEDWMTVQEEIKHEPRLALDGGLDGYLFYRRIIAEAGSYLKEKGMLVLELGIDQVQPVESLLKNYSFKDIQVYKDSGDIARVITAQKNI